MSGLRQLLEPDEGVTRKQNTALRNHPALMISIGFVNMYWLNQKNCCNYDILNCIVVYKSLQCFSKLRSSFCFAFPEKSHNVFSITLQHLVVRPSFLQRVLEL